jgi:hypothetical protein
MTIIPVKLTPKQGIHYLTYIIFRNVELNHILATLLFSYLVAILFLYFIKNNTFEH